MKVFQSAQQFSQFRNKDTNQCAITLGNFDALHLGHRSLLDNIFEYSAHTQTKSLLLTYHRNSIGDQNSDQTPYKHIYTWEEKIEILKQWPLDYLVRLPFTQDLKNTTAIKFIEDILINKLHARYIAVGYDHRFGKNRTGDYQLLQQNGPKYNYQTRQIEPLNFGDTPISSSRIRASIQNGNLQEASQMLGRHFHATGTVVTGKQIGKTMGIPTANLEFQPQKLIPGCGVYAAMAQSGEKKYQAVINIGENPTFPNHPFAVEAHLLDFNRDIYGQHLTLFFNRKIRDEIKFENIDQLKRQILADIEEAKKIL